VSFQTCSIEGVLVIVFYSGYSFFAFAEL